MKDTTRFGLRKEIDGMSEREWEILYVENRIAALEGRTTRKNGAIVQKLRRRLRRLKAEG